MGETALHSHGAGKKHKQRLEERIQAQQFFAPKNPQKITKESDESAEHVDLTLLPATSNVPSATASNSKKIDTCFQNSACQKAEIMWALKHVYNGLSDNSGKDIVELFKTMFPDSNLNQGKTYIFWEKSGKNIYILGKIREFFLQRLRIL
jgi:hypothetical protein